MDIPVFGNKFEDKQYINRPGSYGLLANDQGKIAVISVDENFFLPGGGIENDETPEECLCRELLEELGCKIGDYVHIGDAIDNIKSNKSEEYFTIEGKYFHILEYEIIQEQQDKDHTINWIEPENAAEMLNRGAQRWAVRQYLKFKKKMLYS